MGRISEQGSVTGIAVYPGQAGTVHLAELPRPEAGPGEVVVRVRRVGVCGTDREIIHGLFGSPPAGAAALVLGHEVLGTVEAVGDGVRTVVPGDLVTATVRRPDGCPACQAGQPDLCLWRNYTERGIIGAHGFMTERFVEQERHLIQVPDELEPVGVLLEPLSIVEKAVRQADLIQRRLPFWTPATAIVLGAGPIGLLGTMVLRERGIDVYAVARSEPPTLASELIEASGAHYVSTRQTPLAELAADLPNIDLILEATGVSQLAFEAMALLGNNGVLVLMSLTGGEATEPVPIDLINRELVLGNKAVVGSVNAAHEDFVRGTSRLAAFARRWPGLTERLITARLNGFDDIARIAEASGSGVKTVLEL